MANSLFELGREKFLKGDIDFINDNIMAVLVDASVYTPDLNSNEFLSDIPTNARIAESSLVGRSATGGIADADDTVFTSVPVGSLTVTGIVIFARNDIESESPLIAFIDTVSEGLPITPDGTNITISWDSATNKIFKL